MTQIDQNDSIIENRNSQQKIRILIVDDQNFVRNFLQHILATEPNFQIVGTAINGQDAIKKVASLRPDIVLIDLEMPEMDGLTATAIIARQYSQCKILVLTSYKDSEHLQKALHSGANGYLLKDSSPQEITYAVYLVAQGYTQLSPGLLEKVLNSEVKVVPEAQRENNSQLNLPIKSEVNQKIEPKSTNFFDSLLPLLLLTFGILIPISIFTKVEQTMKVQGQLVAKGETITLDAPREGQITTLEVKEGEKVTQGQRLIQLESYSINEQLQQQQQTLVNQQNQLSSLDFLKNQQISALQIQKQNNQAQALEKQITIEQLQQNLAALKTSYNNYMTEKTAQLETAYEAIAKAKSARQLADIYQSVAQAKVAHYQTENKLKNQNNLLLAKKSLAESQAHLKQIQTEINQANQEFQVKQDNYQKLQQQIADDIQATNLKVQEQQKSHQLLLENNNTAIVANEKSLQQTEQKIALLQQEIATNNALIKNLKSQLQQQNIFSPINGVISELLVKKPGIIVQKKQPLVHIVSEQNPLVFQSQVSQRESKLLQVGIPVQLKIKTNSSQDYTSVPGRLSWIFPSAKIVTNSVASANNNKLASTNDLFIEVELNNNPRNAQNQQTFLIPGKAAIAEIKLQEQSLINLLFGHFK